MEGSTLWVMVIDPERERGIDRSAKSDLPLNVKYKASFVLKEADHSVCLPGTRRMMR